MTVSQKLGVILENEGFKNWSYQNNIFYKKCSPKLTFLNVNKNKEDIENTLLNSDFGTFLTKCHQQLNLQTTVVSFEYVDFWPKILILGPETLAETIG